MSPPPPPPVGESATTAFAYESPRASQKALVPSPATSTSTMGSPAPLAKTRSANDVLSPRAHGRPGPYAGYSPRKRLSADFSDGTFSADSGVDSPKSERGGWRIHSIVAGPFLTGPLAKDFAKRLEDLRSPRGKKELTDFDDAGLLLFPVVPDYVPPAITPEVFQASIQPQPQPEPDHSLTPPSSTPGMTPAARQETPVSNQIPEVQSEATTQPEQFYQEQFTEQYAAEQQYTEEYSAEQYGGQYSAAQQYTEHSSVDQQASYDYYSTGYDQYYNSTGAYNYQQQYDSGQYPPTSGEEMSDQVYLPEETTSVAPPPPPPTVEAFPPLPSVSAPSSAPNSPVCDVDEDKQKSPTRRERAPSYADIVSGVAHSPRASDPEGLLLSEKSAHDSFDKLAEGIAESMNDILGKSSDGKTHAEVEFRCMIHKIQTQLKVMGKVSNNLRLEQLKTLHKLRQTEIEKMSVESSNAEMNDLIKKYKLEQEEFKEQLKNALEAKDTRLNEVVQELNEKIEQLKSSTDSSTTRLASEIEAIRKCSSPDDLEKRVEEISEVLDDLIENAKDTKGQSPQSKPLRRSSKGSRRQSYGSWKSVALYGIVVWAASLCGVYVGVKYAGGQESIALSRQASLQQADLDVILSRLVEQLPKASLSPIPSLPRDVLTEIVQTADSGVPSEASKPPVDLVQDESPDEIVEYEVPVIEGYHFNSAPLLEETHAANNVYALLVESEVIPSEADGETTPLDSEIEIVASEVEADSTSEADAETVAPVLEGDIVVEADVEAVAEIVVSKFEAEAEVIVPAFEAEVKAEPEDVVPEFVAEVKAEPEVVVPEFVAEVKAEPEVVVPEFEAEVEVEAEVVVPEFVADVWGVDAEVEAETEAQAEAAVEADMILPEVGRVKDNHVLDIFRTDNNVADAEADVTEVVADVAEALKTESCFSCMDGFTSLASHFCETVGEMHIVKSTERIEVVADVVDLTEDVAVEAGPRESSANLAAWSEDVSVEVEELFYDAVSESEEDSSQSVEGYSVFDTNQLPNVAEPVPAVEEFNAESIVAETLAADALIDQFNAEPTFLVLPEVKTYASCKPSTHAVYTWCPSLFEMPPESKPISSPLSGLARALTSLSSQILEKTTSEFTEEIENVAPVESSIELVEDDAVVEPLETELDVPNVSEDLVSVVAMTDEFESPEDAITDGEQSIELAVTSEIVDNNAFAADAGAPEATEANFEDEPEPLYHEDTSDYAGDASGSVTESDAEAVAEDVEASALEETTSDVASGAAVANLNFMTPVWRHFLELPSSTEVVPTDEVLLTTDVEASDPEVVNAEASLEVSPTWHHVVELSSPVAPSMGLVDEVTEVEPDLTPVEEVAGSRSHWVVEHLLIGAGVICGPSSGDEIAVERVQLSEASPVTIAEIQSVEWSLPTRDVEVSFFNISEVLSEEAVESATKTPQAELIVSVEALGVDAPTSPVENEAACTLERCPLITVTDELTSKATNVSQTQVSSTSAFEDDSTGTLPGKCSAPDVDFKASVFSGL